MKIDQKVINSSNFFQKLIWAWPNLGGEYNVESHIKLNRRLSRAELWSVVDKKLVADRGALHTCCATWLIRYIRTMSPKRKPALRSPISQQGGQDRRPFRRNFFLDDPSFRSPWRRTDASKMVLSNHERQDRRPFRKRSLIWKL